MMDWQPGDKALCIMPECNLTFGAVYTVIGVFWGIDDPDHPIAPTVGGLALELAEITPPDETDYDGYDAFRFIKADLPEADAFDREVIEALKPVHTPQYERESDTCHSEVDSCASVKRSAVQS